MDKPLREMTDDELQAEWQKWENKVATANGWGAALSAADGFRKQAAREIQRRRPTNENVNYERTPHLRHL